MTTAEKEDARLALLGKFYDLADAPICAELTPRGSARLALQYVGQIDVTTGPVSMIGRRPVAEVTITPIGRNLPYYSVHVGLLSHSAKEQAWRACARRRDDIPATVWQDIIEDACGRARADYRRQGKIQSLGGTVPDLTGKAWTLRPLLEAGQPTTIYAQGGAGKSYLTLMLCAMVDTGASIAGMTASQGRALYLDWEADSATVNRRAWALGRGQPEIPDTWRIDHQRQHAPFTEFADDLAQVVTNAGYSLVVIDSVARALGGTANDDDVVNAFHRALDRVPCAKLLIDHMTKGFDSKERGAFGSGFKRNNVRSQWELEGTPESEVKTLRHTKFNNTASQPTFALRFDIESDDYGFVTSARWSLADLQKVPDELAVNLSVRKRIEALLLANAGALGRPKIHEAGTLAGVKAKTINRAINRPPFFTLPDGRIGLGDKGDKGDN